jgi:hypothetical protein
MWSIADIDTMSETPNHGYNRPEEGTENWHVDLNENFEALDRHVETWTTSDELDQTDPTEGERLLAVDTGIVYEGDGESWLPQYAVGIYNEENGEFTFNIQGNIEASGTKHFVQTVETDTGPREVVYTSTEAPTPRTETSGVAQLTDGRAVVDLPEHFAWVTSEADPLLVQTTPYAAASAGLAAVERSTDRLVVEDRSGEGDYEFAYTVRGTRRGHADKTVVRPPQSVQSGGPSPATTDDD